MKNHEKIKNDEDILNMIQNIEKELDQDLDKKAGDYKELQEWIQELRQSLEGTLPKEDSEVYIWLTGESYSALNDFNI